MPAVKTFSINKHIRVADIGWSRPEENATEGRDKEAFTL
jgi:hypothetical protein